MKRFIIFNLLFTSVCLMNEKETFLLDPIVTIQEIDYYCSIKGGQEISSECSFLNNNRNKFSKIAKTIDLFRKNKTNELFDPKSFKGEKELYIGEMIIDNRRFVLYDKINQTSDRGIVIHRIMRIVDGNFDNKLIVAAIRLVVPNDFMDSDGLIDTTKLSVDRTFVIPFYLRIMIASGFAVGSLDFDRKSYSNALQIGLGAGLMNNFLHNMFPNMNITIVDYEPKFALLSQKFFQNHFDSHHQVFHSEAVHFFKNHVSSEFEYDVMYFDACYNDYPEDTKISCPIKEFLWTENVELFKNALSDDGLFTMTLMYDDKKYSTDTSKEDLYKLVMSNLTKVFPMCHILIYDTALINEVILCGELGNINSLRNRVLSAAKFLGLDLDISD